MVLATVHTKVHSFVQFMFATNTGKHFELEHLEFEPDHERRGPRSAIVGEPHPTDTRRAISARVRTVRECVSFERRWLLVTQCSSIWFRKAAQCDLTSAQCRM